MPPKPSEKRMQHFREMLAYDQAHLGFGASLALVLSVLILIFTVIQQYATRDRL